MRFLFSLAFSAAVVLAQGAAPARKNVVGEVQSADAAAKQLKIKTDAGIVYTVSSDDKTRYMRVGPDLDLKKAANIEVTEIGAGDRVLTRGVVNDADKTIAATSVVVMSKSDVAKKQQHDVAEWNTRGVAGTITAIDPDKHEIAIKVNTIPPKTVTVDASGKVEFRRYAPDSVKFRDAKPSSFADLQMGDGLRILGNKNADGTRYTAEEIVSGSFRTLAVQVVSVDPETHVIKATDLTTKQKTPVTIQVSAETSIHRISEQAALRLASVMNAGPGGAPGGAAGPGGAGAPAGGGMQRRPDGAPAPDSSKSVSLGGPGGPGGTGGPGGGRFGGGRGDLQQMLDHMPTIAVSELKPGDALVISSTNGADRSHLTAISIVAGVEPFLAAAPKSAGAVNLGSWSFDIPAQ